MPSLLGTKLRSSPSSLLCSRSSSALGLRRSPSRPAQRSARSPKKLDQMPPSLPRNVWKRLRSRQEEKLPRKRLLQPRPRLPAEIAETMLPRIGLLDHEEDDHLWKSICNTIATAFFV